MADCLARSECLTNVTTSGYLPSAYKYPQNTAEIEKKHCQKHRECGCGHGLEVVFLNYR